MDDPTTQPPVPDGVARSNALRDGGFSDDEIDAWKGTTSQALQDGGFSPQEIRDYFGTKNPDNSGIKAVAKKGMAASAPATTDGLKPKHETVDASLKPVEAKDVWDAMAAAYGGSIFQMAKTGQESPISVPDDASQSMKLANMGAGLVADSPAMFLGTLGGGAVGGFGVPAGIRATLVDSIRRGDFQGPGDFAKRVVDIGWETAKGAATGLATEMTGGSLKVANAFGSPMVKAITGTAARTAAEIAAQTTVASSLEGHLPSAEDFMHGAVAIGGLHAIGFGAGKMDYVSSKLANIYAETGAHPSEVIEAANGDPSLKGEILSENPELPKEAAGPNPEEKTPEPPADKPEAESKDNSDRDEILSSIGQKAEPEAKSLADKAKEGFSRQYAKSLDHTSVIGDVIKELGDSPLDENNAQVLMRLHAGVDGKIRGFIEDGTRDFDTGKKNGESYSDIIDDVKALGPDGLDDFNAYRIAKRRISLTARDIEQGGNRETDFRFVKENQDSLQPIMDRYVAFRNRTLDYLGASGRYSESQIQAIKDLGADSYAPLKKILEPDPVTGKSPSSTKTIQAIGDSKLDIVDPYVSDVQDVANMIRLAQETHATNTFVGKVLGSEGGEAFLRRSEEQEGPLSKTQIAAYDNGERTLYDTNQDIADSIKRMAGNQPALSVWTDLLKPFATVLRAGTVNNPLFALRHAWRNQMTSGTFSQTGLKPFQSLMYAKEFLANGEAVQDFKYDGGALQQLMETGQDYLDKKIKDLDREAPISNRAWNAAKTAGSFSHFGIVLNDNIVRFAEYKRTLEAGGSRTEAAFAAREVLPDVQKAGLQKSALSQITAFLNVHAQGMARMGQEIKNNPVGYMAKNLAYITVPSLLLYAAQHDDDAINDLPGWQKFNYWNIHVPNWRPANSLAEAMSVKSGYPSNVRQGPDGNWQVNDGTIFRIQKPFTSGIFFGSAFDAAMDSFKKHSPEDFGKFIKTVTASTFAEPIPSGAVGPLEHAMNRNFYTGQPIVRHSMENKLPEFQYDQYTSDTAKELGKLVSYVPLIKDIGPSDAKLASPKVLDNYIHGWTGTLGNYAIDILDKGLAKSGIVPDKVKPIPTLADIPGVKEFVIRFPNAHPQSVEDFMDRYEKADQVHNTINTLMKQGSVQEAVHIQDRYAVNMDRMNGVNRAIMNLNASIQKVNQTPDIDPVQKRQLIDGMMYQMTSMAKQGNLLMDEFEKRAKTKGAGN